MPQSKPTAKTRGRPHDEATAHFMTLDIAIERGDYGAAASAQKALAALGWDVRRRLTYGQPLASVGESADRS